MAKKENEDKTLVLESPRNIERKDIKKKYAEMTFRIEVQDTDTSDMIVEKMFNEIESYLDVIGIRIDCIKIVEGMQQEIRILQPKISDEKTDSFFYENDIARAIRSDGTEILLIASGFIRIKINGEEYNNITKEKAIEKFALTDKKLEDLKKEGALVWKNNNWFEVIYLKEGMNDWGAIDNTVKYNYDAAIEVFNDCYNRKDLNI